MIEQILELDRAVTEATQGLRSEPATAFLTVISFTWLKTLAFMGVAALADHRARRLRAPVTLLAVGAAIGAGARVEDLLKEIFDRPRPPIAAEVDALVALPGSDSFPSGHAVTAFAGATALGALHPRLRWPAFVFAALVAASRPYLGVHFWLDALVGAVVGALLALAVVWLLKRILTEHVKAVLSTGAGVSPTAGGRHG